MFSNISKKEWVPVDGIVLEKNALEAVRSDKNMLVVAGPGAGKTELLAQRACYLLQTNECREPRKILSVSFKRDAAANIKERVLKRCGSKLALRFDSLTFDAFSKLLVDQFLNAIPSEYRPIRDYQIVTDNKELINIIKRSGMFNYIYNKLYNSEIRRLTEQKLPFREDNYIKELWDYLVNQNNDDVCYLTFNMLGRLAEYLIRSNPSLKKALNMTYSHIFIDEYQDTTSIQYDLLKTCFGESNSIITAVGDDKQRIMLWAGALEDAFSKLIEDFNAEETMLMMNHRSAPRLVEIQKIFYREFFYKDKEIEVDIVNNPKWGEEDGESNLYLFKDDEEEAETISSEIDKLLKSGYKCRDICILSKQTPDKYCNKIIKRLEDYGIKARNEVIYQDLLKEEIVILFNTIIKILLEEKAPDEWDKFINLMLELNKNSNNSVYNNVEFENYIKTKIVELKEELSKVSSEEEFLIFIFTMLDIIGIDKLKGKYSKYKNDNTFNHHIDTYYKFLWREYDKSDGDWLLALENFEGEDSIPIMTIHKSKGLEYDAVFFIGLEDGAFWSFKNQRSEDFCSFFVALSRAKRRIDFTFSEYRDFTRNSKESRANISEFYDILESSGIVNIVDKLNY